MHLLPSSIPSPTTGAMAIGSLRLSAYGLMIALGVVVAASMAGRRLTKSGSGTRDDMNSIATWGVIAGIVGARLYHVVTDWSAFSGDLVRIPMIWRGGLGIPGGLLGGVLGGVYGARRRGVPIPQLLTAAAPAVPLAQSIGRWGNWWNQELFGRSTTLHEPCGYPITNFPPDIRPAPHSIQRSCTSRCGISGSASCCCRSTEECG